MIKRIVLNILDKLGYQIQRKPQSKVSPGTVIPTYRKIHYGCGRVYMTDWLNVDIIFNGPENYLYCDLTNRHPFPDECFEYGFSEDFIEHIDQGSSLLFLLEAHRTLTKGGVLRLTFPVLDHVLKKHFSILNFDRFQVEKLNAYDTFGHLHFYSKASLSLVANHVGFDVKFVDAGKSTHKALNDINTRFDEVQIHVELTKR